MEVFNKYMQYTTQFDLSKGIVSHKICGIKSTDKFVLLALSYFSDNEGNSIRPSMETLCNFVQASFDTVNRSIKKLEKLSYISVTRTKVNGRNLVNKYTINVEKVFANAVDCMKKTIVTETPEQIDVSDVKDTQDVNVDKEDKNKQSNQFDEMMSQVRCEDSRPDYDENVHSRMSEDFDDIDSRVIVENNSDDIELKWHERVKVVNGTVSDEDISTLSIEEIREILSIEFTQIHGDYVQIGWQYEPITGLRVREVLKSLITNHFTYQLKAEESITDFEAIKRIV